MDYSRILRQAWRHTSRYRVLWVFGMVVALTTASWGVTFLGNVDEENDALRIRYTITREEGESLVDAARRAVRDEHARIKAEIDRVDAEVEELFSKELDANVRSDILGLFLGLMAVVLTLYALAKIAGYASETALIRMVAETERTGKRLGFREGLRLGVSRTALRIFLINLSVNLTLLLAAIALVALTLAPLLLWATDFTLAGVLGTIVSLLLFFPVLALIVMVAAVTALLKHLFRRACAMEDLGVFASIRRGLAIARRHPVDLLPVWLIAIGVTVAWPLLVLPVAVMMLMFAGILGAAAGLFAGGLAAVLLGGLAPWIIGAVLGFVVFLTTLAAPLVFLGGLREVFLSSTWTLTYDGLLVRERSRLSMNLDAPGIEAATII